MTLDDLTPALKEKIKEIAALKKEIDLILKKD
jgi:hypothetical protein